MREAKKILNILSKRGKQGVPLERVYRLLYNPELYLMVYSKISANNGALTPGTTEETADGMSLSKVLAIIEDVRHERFRWSPIRRVYIPKKDGRQRPLGIPNWKDKLLQGVIQLILEAYYDPQFSDNSHGFRKAHGCHTALQQVKMNWQGTSWFIEGDIKGCFDNINHDTLLSILSRKIHDNRFLRLICNLLKMGYLENWTYHKTYSGTPQGGIVSPTLANIYMHELDAYIEKELIPQYTKGKVRSTNLEYARIKERIKRLHNKGQHEEASALQKHLHTLPKGNLNDPNYRRLKYVRYADDFLLGFTGSVHEAKEIKDKVKAYLSEQLKLELSQEKTLITNATTGRARFLGYELGKVLCDTKLTKINHGSLAGKKRRAVNGIISLYVPEEVIRTKCQQFMKRGEPRERGILTHETDFSIIAKYQSELRGLVQYYLLAKNVSSLHKVKYVMETSMLKTLADKYKSSVNKMARKYKVRGKSYTYFTVTVPRENKKPLVANFGGFPIQHRKWTGSSNDVEYKHTNFFNERNELLKRLLADQCEVCGSTQDCEVHHVRKMADLQYKDGRPKTNVWTRRMVELRRKTLVVCHSCHRRIHGGKLGKKQP